MRDMPSKREQERRGAMKAECVEPDKVASPEESVDVRTQGGGQRQSLAVAPLGEMTIFQPSGARRIFVEGRLAFSNGGCKSESWKSCSSLYEGCVRMMSG